ncbi:hypothetical protein D3C81_1657110 [compost metagenome]
MQFVEQRFEFVIADQVATGCSSGWRGWRRHRSDGRFQRIDGKVTFAVQLVEQCFEFVVSNVGAVARGLRRLRRRRGSRCHCIDGELAFAV